MSYDDWKEAPPSVDETEPDPCPVCTGDEYADPCGEDCATVMRLAQFERGVKALYQRCRTALFLARVYREESSPDKDERIEECMATVRTYRKSIACLREHFAPREGAVRMTDMGYGQVVESKSINGRWVTQRTYWRQDEEKAAE